MDKNIKALLLKLNDFGNKYCEVYLKKWEIDTLKKDNFYSLLFYFSRMFFRGRSDTTSEIYFCFAICKLNKYMQSKEIGDEFYDSLKLEQIDEVFKNFKKRGLKKDNNLNDYIKILEKSGFEENDLIYLFTKEEYLEDIIKNLKECNYGGQIIDKIGKLKNNNKYYLNNVADIKMIFHSFRYMKKNNNFNIYNIASEKINKIGINNLHKELVKEISGIGDKLACFLIRDIQLLEEKETIEKDWEYVFPIDTWVDSISSRIICNHYKNPDEISNDKDIKDRMKKIILEFNNSQNRKEDKIDIKKINAGIWYFGINSLNILLEYFGISKIK